MTSLSSLPTPENQNGGSLGSCAVDIERAHDIAQRHKMTKLRIGDWRCCKLQAAGVKYLCNDIAEAQLQQPVFITNSGDVHKKSLGWGCTPHASERMTKPIANSQFSMTFHDYPRTTYGNAFPSPLRKHRALRHLPLAQLGRGSL